MASHHLSYGRYLSHLSCRYRQLGEELEKNPKDYHGILSRMNRDPVYQSLVGMRPPIANCPKIVDLLGVIEKVEHVAGGLCEELPELAGGFREAINQFIRTAREFVNGAGNSWDDDKSTVIVPVYQTIVGDEGAGLTYLRRSLAWKRHSDWNLKGL